MWDSAQSILTFFVGPVSASRLATTQRVLMVGGGFFQVGNKFLVAISYIFQNTPGSLISEAKITN